MLDCTSVESLCYHGPFVGPCTQTAISANAELDAWNGLYAELDAECDCGAPECGSFTTCNRGSCEEVVDGAVACERYQQDAAAFLAQNGACETDDDCVGVDGICYTGPEEQCGTIPLNTGADLEVWAALASHLEVCEPCGSDPCGASVVCGPEGQCITAFP